MQNIELKVRHQDLGAVREAARRLGAHHEWTRTQKDTYFAVPDARLKVREMPTEAEIIFYRRSDATTPRPSTYTLVPVGDPGAACALLGELWAEAGVVEKQRELWLWHNVRIHLDTVTGLGTFVELEGVIGPDADASVSRTRVDRAIEALGLAGGEPVPASYRDLITAVPPHA